MNRDKYRKAWLRAHKGYERKMLNIFRRYFITEANKIPFDFLTEENYTETIKNNIAIYGLYNAYYDAYNQIGLIHGNRVGKAINRDIKEFNPIIFQSEYQRGLFNWILDNVGYRIVSVYSEYVKYIQRLMASGLVEGKTIRQVSADVYKLINNRNFYRWQAMRIVRTESTAAANRASIVAGNTSSIVYEKIWISGHDARVRHLPNDTFDHRVMDGVKVDKDDFFKIPSKYGFEFLEYPGADKTKEGRQSSAGNVINCRCNSALIPKRDKNGKLIRI